MVFVVHKWKSPVKSFKLNGKQYAGKFKRGQFVDVGSKVLPGKVSVKAAKGWKFKGIEAEGWTKNYDLKTAKVKNGKTLAKSKKMQCVIAWFANKKSAQEIPDILKWKEYAPAG